MSENEQLPYVRTTVTFIKGASDAAQCPASRHVYGDQFSAYLDAVDGEKPPAYVTRTVAVSKETVPMVKKFTKAQAARALQSGSAGDLTETEVAAAIRLYRATKGA